MNSKTPKGGNPALTTRRRQVIHKKETHSVSQHPKLWEFAKKRTEQLGYTGGVSGYIGGLILFDLIANRKHWLTVDFMNDAEQLEAALFEIQEQPPENWGSWIDAKLREISKAPEL